jgi:hypothetical protein
MSTPGSSSLSETRARSRRNELRRGCLLKSELGWRTGHHAPHMLTFGLTRASIAGGGQHLRVPEKMAACEEASTKTLSSWREIARFPGSDDGKPARPGAIVRKCRNVKEL